MECFVQLGQVHKGTQFPGESGILSLGENQRVLLLRAKGDEEL